MRDAVSACAFAGGIAVCLLIVLPVTIDRSISVFMLTQMAAQPDHAFTPSELRSLFVDIYVERYEQIERRLRGAESLAQRRANAKRLPDHAAGTVFCSVCASLVDRLSDRSAFRHACGRSRRCAVNWPSPEARWDEPPLPILRTLSADQGHESTAMGADMENRRFVPISTI